MHKSLASLLILLFLSLYSRAQDVYYTRNATLTINASIDGEIIHFKSDQLSARLDYETAEIIMRMPINSLQSGIDSLDRQLRRLHGEAVFDGKLGLEYINTDNHPPLNFDLEGWLILDLEKHLISGKGQLHHNANSSEYACMLGLEMILNFEELNIHIPVENLDAEFEIVVTQALLQRDKN
ncbi:MAG: hypothetical protein Kow0027_01600 [Saprospiraceae bacterium]